jgi:hypothetical protein
MRAPISSVVTELASPSEAAALFRLDLLNPWEIVRLCERWLEEDRDQGSPEVAAIACESPGSPSPDLRRGFGKAIGQLAGAPPSIEDAARTAVRLYVRAIADGRVPPEPGMDALDEDLDFRFRDWPVRLIRSPDRPEGDETRYAGEALGLEGLFTWRRELSDAEDGDPLFYFNDLPRDAQIERFRQELRAAAGRLAEQLEAPA